MKQCAKGHLYDETKNAVCPYCNGSATQGKAVPLTEGYNGGFNVVEALESIEKSDNGFKFIIYRPKLISDTPDVTYDVTYEKALNITEQTVLIVLKQNPEISREEIAEKISKTVRTVQRALVSLTEKGYIRRVGAKKNSTWEVLR